MLSTRSCRLTWTANLVYTSSVACKLLIGGTMKSWINAGRPRAPVNTQRAVNTRHAGRHWPRLLGAAWGILAVCFGLVATTLAFTEKQAQQGAAVFAFYCSTCHGDRGEGLTDAFRATWPAEDQNCWTPKCHGPQHPNTGFLLPRYVPALVGSDLLKVFPDVSSLYDFVKEKMPYQDPSLLTDQERRAVVAFLLRENGIRPERSYRRPMPR